VPIKFTHSSINDAIIGCQRKTKRILKEADLIAEKPALAMDKNRKPAFLLRKDFRATMSVYVGAPNATILYQENKILTYTPMELNYLTNHSIWAHVTCFPSMSVLEWGIILPRVSLAFLLHQQHCRQESLFTRRTISQEGSQSSILIRSVSSRFVESMRGKRRNW
jgi:hypothetical protein